jgi:hypothetical protein
MKRTILIGVIVVAMVFGVVAYASAADATVNISATAQPHLTISTNVTDLTFAGLTPEVDAAPAQTVDVTVKSNKAHSLTSVASGEPELTIKQTLANHAATDLARGSHTFSDDVTVQLSYDAAAGHAYTGSIVYTALQNAGVETP